MVEFGEFSGEGSDMRDGGGEWFGRAMRWAALLPLAMGAAPAVAAQADRPPSAIEQQGAMTVAEAIQALNDRHSHSRPSRSMAAVPASSPSGWFTGDNYPVEARRAGRQGRVVVDLGIDSAGMVVSCVVKSSSGTTILDDGTCAVAREHGRFNPAIDNHGRPIAGHYLMPVRWVLPDTPPPPLDLASTPLKRTRTVEVFFTAAGVLTSCRIVEAEPRDEKDEASICPAEAIGSQQAPMLRKGVPTAYKIVRHDSVEIIPTE